jgi:cold shock CspA family protein
MATTKEKIIVKATTDKIGEYTGQCKWFNDKYGYGFIKIIDGPDKDTDIFVHHSGIKPLNSQYKTLNKGEYIHFSKINGINGSQAVNITGINGGPLMCDINMGAFKPNNINIYNNKSYYKNNPLHQHN